jgi:cytochrome c biogenesis protein CcmG/thiol:disulfide interchange protein DsbE
VRSHRVRWIALGVGLVVVLLGVVLALNVEGSTPNTSEGRFVGEEAPRFVVQTLDGDELSLDALAGKTVVVNFWNTWCIPCIREAPALQTFYERHAGERDFAMIGIVRDDTAAAVRSYVRDTDIGWTIGFDPKSKAALAYGTTGQPETFVIGPDGRVAGEQFSETRVEDLELMLRAARGTL